MAAGQLNPSRAARLDAPACPAQWARALAEFRAAEEAMAALEVVTVQTCGPRLRREHDRRLASMYDALRRLLAVPAPDAAAFARKVQLAIDHQMVTDSDGMASLAAIRRDTPRFTGGD